MFSLQGMLNHCNVMGNCALHSDPFTDPSQAPTKPDLKMIEVNLVGVSYTAKLAIHYLRRPSGEEDRDRSLILKSSIAGYVDMPPFPQYNISKWGIRGLMRNLRRVTWSEGIRVNLVAPW